MTDGRTDVRKYVRTKLVVKSLSRLKKLSPMDIGDMDKKETRRNESIGEKDKGGRKKRDKDIKTKEIGECWALR